MSDLVAVTGWVTEAPAGDVATLLYYPATGVDLDPDKIAQLAGAWGMGPLGDTLKVGWLPPAGLPPLSHEWEAAAQAQGRVVVLLTALQLSAPTLHDVDTVTADGAPTWGVLAPWR